MIVRSAGCLLLAGFVCTTPLDGQEVGLPLEEPTIFEKILSFYSPFILPKIFQDVHRLREYIRADEFASLRERYGDLVAVDRIYETAMQITWGNRYEALLITMAATMNHRNIGIRIGPVGTFLWLPLSSEFPDEFRMRVNNLPRRLYPDSPATAAGDSDKLQHFFGSAFLAFTFEARGPADRVGDMVELGEHEFVERGLYDERDRRANSHGRSFGLALLANPEATPSMFLQLVTAEGIRRATADDVPGPCVPPPLPEEYKLEAR